jgi:2-desacetyl-2-hydroxyethyl bacteriochlorophyllide A dehydrogenase
MRAIVTDGTGEVWEEERERPQPDAGEVLVRVRAVGICGSDIGLIHGEGPPWADWPMVPGHEVCAEVLELGEGVEDLSVGDRVVQHGFVYCGTCKACREGRYYQCDEIREIGFSVDGGYREYEAVPAYTVTPLPDDVSDLEATQIDSAGCTLHALQRVETRFDDVGAVLGPGSLGLFGVQLLRCQGVDDVILTGTRQERLAVGEDLGADLTVNIREENPVDAVHDYTNGDGVDVAVEAAGAGDVIETSLAIAATRGSVVITGVFDEEKQIDPNHILMKELTVVGGVSSAHTIEQITKLFQRGDLTIDGIVTDEFDLADYETAIETVQNRRDGVIKAVLRP